MTTHFAAVKDGLIVGVRSSASRSVAFPVGHKFGPYSHAILRTERVTVKATGASTESTDVISWHGGLSNATAGLHKGDKGSYYYNATATVLGAEILEVVIVPRKGTIGARIQEAA